MLKFIRYPRMSTSAATQIVHLDYTFLNTAFNKIKHGRKVSFKINVENEWNWMKLCERIAVLSLLILAWSALICIKTSSQISSQTTPLNELGYFRTQRNFSVGGIKIHLFFHQPNIPSSSINYTHSLVHSCSFITSFFVACSTRFYHITG